jgi:2-polyprenyl-3-methyl-5-hydroxy-6-metoxy-1,4-benzoquinol methylase
MRKDYIAAAEPADHETEFVEKYWTTVWENEGGPQGQLGRIPQKEEFRAMVRYLAKFPKGARILDGGCGLGDWTLYLARQGFSVAGLDLSRKTVEQLKVRFPETEFMSGDIRQTGFSDDSFDAYFSWGVFEHFESGPQDCLREAWRILKPGGLLFISVPLDNLRHALLGAFARPQIISSEARFYQYRFTRAELARELAIGGFDVCEVRCIHKRQGVLRSLHHELGFPYDWLLTKGLSAVIAPFVPGSFIAHMVLAVARKPESGVTHGG